MAAFISGLTGTSDAAGIGANFTSALAARLEDASLQDQSLACANLATVLAHLYTCSLLPASTIYSFLDHLVHRCVCACYVLQQPWSMQQQPWGMSQQPQGMQIWL